jgi:uncharacterized Ntn-hydrolase superfamily protein
MTWSVVACDKASGQLGVAVATRFFAAGALVPFVAAKVGAIATQALVNPYYGIDGLRNLREGHSPHETMEILKRHDAARPIVRCRLWTPAAGSRSTPGRAAYHARGMLQGTIFLLPGTCWPASALSTMRLKPIFEVRPCRFRAV